jgi:hypothetical protein
MTNGREILFGDIHNHNACGYGIGSLERSIDIAKTHLDFFAFTGHSSWHDMEPMEGGREHHWLNGFEKLKDAWPTVQNLIADANRDDTFSAFLGFEWHSNTFGDQCVVFPTDHQPIATPDHIQQLRAFCRDCQALMIPHHLAYPQGHRGVNWQHFDPSCTPVVEIFSEHGNSENDRGSYPFFSHSMGPRETSQTVAAALKNGHRFGFVASSDSHSGFPGAYDEGLLAVHSQGRDRAAILDAINRRHTYALTGDRILVDFSVNGELMGSTITAGDEVEVAYDIRCPDELDVIEILQDGEIIFRDYPQTGLDLARAVAEPFQVRLEWGWGPWGDLALDRIADWVMEIEIQGGRLQNIIPCLRSGPFDEQRRHRFERKSANKLGIVSYSSREGAYRQNPNHSVVLEIVGDAATALTLNMSAPAKDTSTVTVGDLYHGSSSRFTGPFPQECFQWHRLVGLPSSRVARTMRAKVPGHDSHIYLRAKQQNGQIAWASPVFINHS